MVVSNLSQKYPTTEMFGTDIFQVARSLTPRYLPLTAHLDLFPSSLKMQRTHASRSRVTLLTLHHATRANLASRSPLETAPVVETTMKEETLTREGIPTLGEIPTHKRAPLHNSRQPSPLKSPRQLMLRPRRPSLRPRTAGWVQVQEAVPETAAFPPSTRPKLYRFRGQVVLCSPQQLQSLSSEMIRPPALSAISPSGPPTDGVSLLIRQLVTFART